MVLLNYQILANTLGDSMNELEFQVIEAKINSCFNKQKLRKYQTNYSVSSYTRILAQNPKVMPSLYSNNLTLEEIAYYDKLYSAANKRLRTLFGNQPKSPFSANTKPPNRRKP